MVRSFAVPLFIAVSLTVSLAGQHSTYSGLETREIKALSEEEIKGYLEGRGMSLALPAELNGYPGPKHVLELEPELELTPEQSEKVKTQFETMQRAAREIGAKIVEVEEEIERLFSSNAATAATLQALINRAAALHGQLRFTHLNAHVGTTSLLSREQIRRYAELRGYAHGDAHGHH